MRYLIEGLNRDIVREIFLLSASFGGLLECGGCGEGSGVCLVCGICSVRTCTVLVPYISVMFIMYVLVP